MDLIFKQFSSISRDFVLRENRKRKKQQPCVKIFEHIHIMVLKTSFKSLSQVAGLSHA